MLSHRIVRFLHTNSVMWQSTNKALLGKLRKKTGYTFSNCKKALELSENNLERAEAWLKEQAQTLGWTKAEKLQGRSTTQGLIAVIVNECHGSLVEINCETDFVARNEQFLSLTDTIASAVLKHASTFTANGSIHKTFIDANTIKSLVASDGKTVADHSALTIGNVGENISIRRGLCISVAPDVKLVGSVHPTPTNPLGIAAGKYGALLAYKTTDTNPKLGEELCQHIIGMNPTKIGDASVDEPNKVSEEETTLIYQEYITDPDVIVAEVLRETGTQILDFARFSVGEPLETPQNLDVIEVGN